MPKEKLTLSVDSALTEKAKALGLNISELTETLLRGFVFSSKEVDKEAFYSAYRKLFETMYSLLKEYNTPVTVAEIQEFDPNDKSLLSCDEILLYGDGTLWNDGASAALRDITDLDPSTFLTPKEILSNFIKALVDAKRTREERVKELEFVTRMVQAITESLTGPAASPRQKPREPGTKSENPSNSKEQRQGRRST